MASGSSRSIVTEAMETRRRVKALPGKAGSVTRIDRSRERPQVLEEIDHLLFKQSLAERLSFLEETCGWERVLRQNLQWKFRFEAFHSLLLGFSRFLKMCGTQHVSWKEVCSHTEGLPSRQKRLSLLRLLLFKACNGKVALIEEKYRVPGLHEDFAMKKCRRNS